jgi:hypothetical protein
LYVLVFPVRGVFKVGKADVIVRRMHTLERTWGAVDVRASYHVAADRDTVFTLERTLLMVLSDHAVGEEVGVGRTELSSLAAMELALKQLELFSAARAVPLALRQGLPAVLTDERRRRTPVSRFTKLQRNAILVTDSLASTVAQFAYINRILVVLARSQHKVAYQFDELEPGRLCFRFEARGHRGPAADQVREVLGVRCYDHTGHLHTTLYSVHRTKEVVQYSVLLPWVQSPDFRHPVLEYLWSLTEQLLTNVPRRSAALRRRLPYVV